MKEKQRQEAKAKRSNQRAKPKKTTAKRVRSHTTQHDEDDEDRPFLPPEMLDSIFGWLDAASLDSASLVNKYWNQAAKTE